MYAILDIETTGGKYNDEGITEIAIHKFDGYQVIDSFITLVNPEKPIQEFVVKLTGINNTMLKNAPKFYEIAKRIIEITKDTILVAHNTSFDYRILKTEFKRLSYDFNMNTLCTVELSRKLIPNQPSYSLGKLVRSLGIPVSDRHRANGDALATIQLFKLLLEKDVNKSIFKTSIKYFDNRTIKEKLVQIINSAPEVMGVFYAHNQKGKIIFIGRGNNIKQEVSKLFLKNTKRTLKIQEYIVSISFEKTGNELITRLKYFLELHALNPKYNFVRGKKMTLHHFKQDNFMIVGKGREIEENSIILIEKNEVIGYGHTNLASHEHQLDILKSILTPIYNPLLAKTIVKNYLSKNSVAKITRY